MASIDKYTSKTGTVSYRARVRRNGLPTITQTFSKLSDAQRWAATQDGLALARVGDCLRKMEVAKDDLYTTEGTPQYLIADVFQRYNSEILPQKRVSTARSQRYQLSKLQRLLGASTPLNTITPADIRV